MKLKHFLFPMLLIFAGLGFTACSSGSSTSDEGDDDEPEKNLAKEARPFVGYWKTTGSTGGDYLFFGDGTCWFMKLEKWNKHSLLTGSKGSWNYDPDTKTLSTTVGAQWQVTLPNENEWSGKSQSSDDSFKREQDKLEYLKLLLTYSSWKENKTDSTLSFGVWQSLATNSNKKYTEAFDGMEIMWRKDNSDINLGKGRYLELKHSGKDDYVFTYNLRECDFSYGKYSTKKLGTGTLTLKNPTSSTTCRIVLTGHINKTFTLTDVDMKKD